LILRSRLLINGNQSQKTNYIVNCSVRLHYGQNLS